MSSHSTCGSYIFSTGESYTNKVTQESAEVFQQSALDHSGDFIVSYSCDSDIIFPLWCLTLAPETTLSCRPSGGKVGHQRACHRRGYLECTPLHALWMLRVEQVSSTKCSPHNILCPQAQSNKTKRSWTKVSETISQTSLSLFVVIATGVYHSSRRLTSTQRSQNARHMVRSGI